MQAGKQGSACVGVSGAEAASRPCRSLQQKLLSGQGVGTSQRGKYWQEKGEAQKSHGRGRQEGLLSSHGHVVCIPPWAQDWHPTIGLWFGHVVTWLVGLRVGIPPQAHGWHPTASVLAFTVWLLRVLISTAFWETHSAGKEFGQKHEGSSAPLLLELPPGAALSSGQHLAAPAVDPSLLPQPFPCTVTTR